MTALPRPGRLLTIADYAALPEDDQHRWELMEGNLVMSPSPTPQHMIAMGELHAQLRTQVPADMRVVVDVDLDLQLAPERQPGSSRRPDLVVVTRAELDRVGREGGLLRADAVSLVVEIISPGSRRTDLVVKRGEYADAGIDHYWIIDLDPRPSLVACHRAGGFGYQDSPAAVDAFQTREPFPVAVELNALA
ncbi:MAG: Uma2 family endonuclease [Sciscionella sp.]